MDEESESNIGCGIVCVIAMVLCILAVKGCGASIEKGNIERAAKQKLELASQRHIEYNDTALCLSRTGKLGTVKTTNCYKCIEIETQRRAEGVDEAPGVSIDRVYNGYGTNTYIENNN